MNGLPCAHPFDATAASYLSDVNKDASVLGLLDFLPGNTFSLDLPDDLGHHVEDTPLLGKGLHAGSMSYPQVGGVAQTTAMHLLPSPNGFVNDVFLQPSQPNLAQPAVQNPFTFVSPSGSSAPLFGSWTQAHQFSSFKEPSMPLHSNSLPTPRASRSREKTVNRSRSKDKRGDSSASKGSGEQDEGADFWTSSVPNTQEKNRSAQRRFRQRQKQKMVGLESKVDTLAVQLSNLSTENESLRKLNNVLEKVLDLRDEHINGLQDAVKIFNAETEPTAEDKAVRQAIELGQDKYNAAAVSKMTAEDVIDSWCEKVKQISVNMTMLDAGPEKADPNCLSQIKALVSDCGALCTRVAMYAPTHIKRLLSTNLETKLPAVYVEEHWQQVVRGLYLNERQRADIVDARQRFVAGMSAIFIERSKIRALLGNDQPPAMAHALITSASLAAHEALDRLKENLRAEHNLHMDFVVFMFKNTMNPLQLAKSFVISYPFFPDPMAIATIIAGGEKRDASPSSPSGSGGTAFQV